MYQRTPEQEAILRIRNGINVIAANAGTGKTASLTDLFVSLYLKEEQKLFPHATGHVSGDDQRRILEQFMPVTFTRDAAAEFTERVTHRFKEAEIPVALTRFGQPWRFCRTLDSYVRDWFRRLSVFTTWMHVDPDFSQAIDHAIKKMGPTAQSAFAAQKSPRFAFHRSWEWQPHSGVEDMITDLIVRDAEGLPPVPGLPPLSAWEADWHAWLGTFDPSVARKPGSSGPAESFWQPKLAAFRAHQDAMRDMKAQYQQGQFRPDSGLQQKVEQIHIWDRIQLTKREFGTAHTLARARGYHPVRAKDRMMTMNVLQELSACDYVFRFEDFHRLAQRLYAAKAAFLFADYTDLANVFMEVAESNPGLLERNCEYPSRGIRAKYTLIDEAQDLSYFQIRLVRMWRPRDEVDFCIVLVGDVAQAIYGWRGASTYGFASMIEEVRKNTPEKLFHLTCSFRSLTSIVDLGNTIAASLPQFKNARHPSVTVYTTPGNVEVMPPCANLSAEGDIVCTRIAAILKLTNDTVMVLHRNNFNNHPILDRLKSFGSSRLRWLTIHRSKGLQDDHVFVLGLTSGIIPDVRGTFVQEINLFYVACTRARKALYLSAPFTKLSVDKNTGLQYEETVGPSAFFARTEILAKKADNAGWPPEMIARGEARMEKDLRVQQARTEVRSVQLRLWWTANYPHIPFRHANDEQPREETGTAPAPASIRNLPKVSIWDTATPFETLVKTTSLLDATDPAADERKAALFRKLRMPCLKGLSVPRLTGEPYIIAIRSNWVYKATGGGLAFTQVFRALARNPPKTEEKAD
jgi:ATP-dependent exoDNAse (exonuclease V) beta subunit